MKTIVLPSQRGASAKTTLAAHLAVTILVTCDAADHRADVALAAPVAIGALA
jgi:hypothetical protein